MAISDAKHTKDGTTLACRVWKKQRDGVASLLREFDLEHGHMIPSERAIHAVECPPALRHLACEQMLVSTEAFLVMHLHWEHELRRGFAKTAAAEILGEFCHVTLGRNVFFAAWSPALWADIEEPLCSLQPSQQATCDHIKFVEEMVHAAETKQYAETLEIARHCFNRREKCGRVGAVCAHLVRMLSQTIDEHVGTRGKPDASSLKVARGQKRARNLDAGLREEMFGAVREGRFRSVSGFQRGLKIGVHEKTTLAMEKTRVNDYFWTTAAHGASTLQWSVAMDAARLGGEDTSCICVYFPAHRLAAWLVPQVCGDLHRKTRAGSWGAKLNC